MIRKLIRNIHIIIILYSVYLAYEYHEKHTIEMQQAEINIKQKSIKIKKLKKERKDITKYFDDIENAKARIEKVLSQVEDLQKKFPSTVSATEDLDMINELARGLKMKEVKLRPLSERNKGFYFEKPYKINFSGTYLQTLIFLEKIGQQDRLFNIVETKLEKKSNKSKGRFQVVEGTVEIVSYRYNSGHKESGGIDKIEEEFYKKKNKKGKK